MSRLAAALLLLVAALVPCSVKAYTAPGQREQCGHDTRVSCDTQRLTVAVLLHACKL